MRCALCTQIWLWLVLLVQLVPCALSLFGLFKECYGLTFIGKLTFSPPSRTYERPKPSAHAAFASPPPLGLSALGCSASGMRYGLLRSALACRGCCGCIQCCEVRRLAAFTFSLNPPSRLFLNCCASFGVGGGQGRRLVACKQCQARAQAEVPPLNSVGGFQLGGTVLRRAAAPAVGFE